MTVRCQSRNHDRWKPTDCTAKREYMFTQERMVNLGCADSLNDLFCEVTSTVWATSLWQAVGATLCRSRSLMPVIATRDLGYAHLYFRVSLVTHGKAFPRIIPTLLIHHYNNSRALPHFAVSVSINVSSTNHPDYEGMSVWHMHVHMGLCVGRGTRLWFGGCPCTVAAFANAFVRQQNTCFYWESSTRGIMTDL